MTTIPNKNNYTDNDKYQLEVDKFFYERYGFKKWFETLPNDRLDIVEKLIPVCPKPILEDEGDRCITYSRYEKGGLK